MTNSNVHSIQSFSQPVAIFNIISKSPTKGFNKRKHHSTYKLGRKLHKFHRWIVNQNCGLFKISLLHFYVHHIKLGCIIFPEPTKPNLSNVATACLHAPPFSRNLTFLPPYFISSKGLRRACTLPYMGITGAKSRLLISGFSLKAKTKTKFCKLTSFVACFASFNRFLR